MFGSQVGSFDVISVLEEFSAELLAARVQLSRPASAHFGLRL